MTTLEEIRNQFSKPPQEEVNRSLEVNFRSLPIVCLHCNKAIDPDICWCGNEKKDHPLDNCYNFVPIGCTCYQSL